MSDPLFRLRLISWLEGTSFLVLLYFSVVEKRLLGKEDAILIPGYIHGGLFLLFCLALLNAWIERRWSWKRAGLGFLCSILPFMPFWFERSLEREQKALATIKS